MASADEIIVTLPGGRRVDAQVGPHTVRTDQPVSYGGEDTAPSPFQLFLAAIGTCAGIFVQGFCAKRDIPFEGIRILQRSHFDPEGVLVGVDLDIEVPPEFPEKYREALVRVADKCSVKRAIAAQPTFTVRSVVGGSDRE
jgi:ribosomal protein S12 methylthiotransferase accessory factor